jgi:cytochrome b
MTERDPEFKFAGEERVVPVWDLGVRVFHWALVLLVLTSFVTMKAAEKIGANAITYHAWAGYGILTLLVFRILWGFAGGTHARFANFVRGPGAVIAYMKGMFDRAAHHGSPTFGHNAMGALSVVAMLLVLLFQACSGLFTNVEDYAFEGPLYKWVGKELSDKITSLHHFNEKIIIALVLLHVAAILFYLLFHKENLVRPMLTGVKRVAGNAGQSRHGSTVLAVVLLAASGVGVYFLVNAAR